MLAFREATDTTHSTYRNADIGAAPPRIDTVEQWASALQISPCWLAFGGAYPANGRGRHCALILRRLPEPWLELGRFRQIFESEDASAPTTAEWAWIVQSWLSASQMDLPHLAALVAGIRGAASEEEAMTKRFYPGLAEFLGNAAEPPEGPTSEEKETLRSLQFPDSMGAPSPHAFRVLWEEMRNYQVVRSGRRR